MSLETGRSASFNAVRWHNERRRRLFRDHPEVRALVGRNPWTALPVLGLAFGQLGMAAFLDRYPWWVAVLCAYLFGALVSHALGVLIHELSHDLVFASPLANRFLAMVANVPMVFPAAMDFRHKHLLHHQHLGEPNGADTQAPLASDVAFASSPLRTTLWHCFEPLFSRKATSSGLPWLLLNALVHVVVLAPFTWLFGWTALLYLSAAGWFAFGPHPLGARRYGEHLTLRRDQPTVSYYGPVNALSFNVGYHVEHHDVQSIPWNRLTRLRRLAPELYEPLASIGSWTRLAWQLFTAPGEGPRRYWLERPFETPLEGQRAEVRSA